MAAYHIISTLTEDWEDFDPRDAGFDELPEEITGRVHWLQKIHGSRIGGKNGVPFSGGIYKGDPTPPFAWTYAYDQITVLLEGEISAELDDGERIHLQKGDVIYIERGLSGTWSYPKPYKILFLLFR